MVGNDLGFFFKCFGMVKGLFYMEVYTCAYIRTYTHAYMTAKKVDLFEMSEVNRVQLLNSQSQVHHTHK